MPTLQLHQDKFEIMIERRGRLVEWQEAVLCSCWNIQSGQPAYGCKACKGHGYLYGDPYQNIALVMSVALNKQSEETLGLFEVGDAIMTVPRRHPVKRPDGTYDNTTFILNLMFDIGMFDRITLLDDEYKSSEVLTKGANDTLSNEKITRIKSVQQANKETGVITTYEIGSDFIMQKNQVQWIGNHAPESGSQYSVIYFHRPVYTVIADLPKPRHQDKQDLPKYVVLRYQTGSMAQRGG